MLLTFLQIQNKIRYDFQLPIINWALLAASRVMVKLQPVHTIFVTKMHLAFLFCTYNPGQDIWNRME